MPDPNPWSPPSAALHYSDGIWRPSSVSAVSYPDDGNELCFQQEDRSYWFSHRNNCIFKVLANYPPGGLIYDIGGGNGFEPPPTPGLWRDGSRVDEKGIS